MRHIALKLAYNGAAYHGWQVQKNAVAVQQMLQDALQKVLLERPDVTGCSRTDAGVHARGYVCSFRTENPLGLDRLFLALNNVLPGDAALLACAPAPEGFHARYSAAEKEYVYRIDTSPRRDPFSHALALHYPHPLDEAALTGAAQAFVGTRDFSALCASGATVKTTVRTVTYAAVTREGTQVYYTVRADGFLYNMVRIMVGTLLYVAQRKLAPAALPGILASLDRTQAGPTAPPEGLYLNRVLYPPELDPFASAEARAAPEQPA